MLAGLVFGVYLLTGLDAGGQAFPLMPVDDAYIHFQYGRQITLGQPYVYNPGQPPTSGATSLLYPYILALGYSLGFQELALGLWAMLIGALALAVSTWGLYRLLRLLSLDVQLALLLTSAYGLSGLVGWHAMSGMETALMAAFTLLTLLAFYAERRGALVIAALLLTLTRPEGALFAGWAVLLYGLRALRREGWQVLRHPGTWTLLIPVLAVGTQPLLNLLLTGSASASGGQAKSLFSMVPTYPDVIAQRILDNLLRIITELLVGIGENDIWFLPPLLGLVGLMGGLLALRHPAQRWTVLLVILWIISVGGSIATLDTAFWHFKRYQVPLLILAYPMTGLLLVRLPARWRSPVAALILGLSLVSAWGFRDYYAQNTRSVAAQPLAMARWLADNTPKDAVVAVHDVGMMRYIGQRTTLDMVGLTTPDAADSWRNGPGAVAEFSMDTQPDYVAAYTTARGLNYLADTSLYGELLAAFNADYDPRYNVALGAPYQGIYRVTWTPNPSQLFSDYLRVRVVNPDAPLTIVNVANLNSESTHGYTWRNAERLPGFATEAYELPAADCTRADCISLDGGRLINGEEAFTVQIPAALIESGQDLVLVTRVHATHSGHFDVYANDNLIDRQWLPTLPGQWLEIGTLIPREWLAPTLHVRIVPETPNSHYVPYTHLVYPAADTHITNETAAIASYQDGTLLLERLDSSLLEDKRLIISLHWSTDGTARGVYRHFVHLYDDRNAPPVVQADALPIHGTQPPGNWLPGSLVETIVVDLDSVSPGTYSLSLGLYDPANGARLMPTLLDEKAVEVDAMAQRLFFDEIRVSTND